MHAANLMDTSSSSFPDMASRYEPYAIPARRRVRPSRLFADVVSGAASAESSATAAVDDATDMTGNRLPDWLDLRKMTNRFLHRTKGYENPEDYPQAIFSRRGQVFQFRVSTSMLKEEGSSLWVTLQSDADAVSRFRGSFIQLEEDDEGDDFDWRLKRVTDHNNDKWTDFEVVVPVNAAVSKYDVKFEIWTQKVDDLNDDEDLYEGWSLLKDYSTKWFLFFNPWCPDDDVFLDNEEERNEFVLNDSGKVYCGTRWKPWARPWNFAQFERSCYEAAFKIIGRLDVFDTRSDVVEVLRFVSQMVNGEDRDNGVLAGKWGGDYGNHPRPWSWVGSGRILELWLKEGHPVKWAQCWVFSAVVTTVCRALGIPCRSVTNFSSGHDTNENLVLEFYVTPDGSDRNDDSAWNFHVWNEAWCKREDLPGGLDGWQAFDATPQEYSDGLMRCGPASVAAIKEGKVKFPHDAKFIFAEVNGTRIYYTCTCEYKWFRHNGPHKVIKVDSKSIGKKISTKAVGSDDRLDLTHLYKHPEGSAEEEAVLERVYPRENHHIKKLLEHMEEEKKKLKCSFKVNPSKSIKAGDSLEATLHLSTGADVVFDFDISVRPFDYMAKPLADAFLSTQQTGVELAAGGKKVFNLIVDSKEYLRFVKDDAFLHVIAKVTPKDATPTDVFFDRFVIDVDLPEVLMEELESEDEEEAMEEEGRSEEEKEEKLPRKTHRVKMSFVNSLDRKLKNCVFRLEGGLMDKFKSSPAKSLEPGETLEEIVRFRPKKRGTVEILGSFISDGISSTGAALKILVE